MSKPDPHGPADTSEMGVIHSALRRDLERARLVLADQPSPERARVVGEHLVWLMRLLHHHHHTNEDEHYWPATLERNPAAAPLLEAMEADHAGLVGPLADLEQEAAALVEGTGHVFRVLDAIAALSGPLNEHLRREELEMMPVVAQSWTHAEHAEFIKVFVAGRPLGELIHEGMWLVDNADDHVRQAIFGKVPVPVSFVLRRVFGRRYDQHKQQLWGGTPAFDLAPIPVTP